MVRLMIFPVVAAGRSRGCIVAECARSPGAMPSFGGFAGDGDLRHRSGIEHKR